MADWVVDTNVLLVATRCELGAPPMMLARRGEDVPVQDEEAQEAVFRWLQALRRNGDDRVVLDGPHRLITTEYGQKLQKSELGRRVIAYKLSRGEVRWVDVEMDENGDALLLDENPESVTDRADRRMVAAAMESGAPIANACDTDWMDLRANGTLERLGIHVHHVIEEWCSAEWHRKHGTTP